MEKPEDIKSQTTPPGGSAYQRGANANTLTRRIVLAVVIIGLVVFGFILQFATLT